LFTIEVLHKDGPWFEPYIEDLEAGCLFVFHDDDITDEGCAAFADVFTEQARRWQPRGAEAPLGPQIPITMELEEAMPEGMAILVDDHPEYISYMVWSELISERGAELISRKLAERSPFWIRLPAKYHVQLRAV